MPNSYKILICPYGNPAGWHEVNYKYSGLEKKSKTTLPLLYETESPNKVIIIISDTLSDNKRSDFSTEIKYADIKEKSRRIISEFFEKEGIKINYELIIGYGSGTFRNNTVFIGEPRDFYYSVLYQLEKVLENVIINDFEELQIILDITHGVNFMPVFTYKIIFEIAQILAYFINVNIKILNTDPALGEIKEANINIIEEKKVYPQLFLSKPKRKLLSPSKYINDLNINKSIKNITQILNEINNKIHDLNFYPFGASFLFCLPLWIFYYKPNDCINLEPLINSFEQFIEVKNIDNKLYITRKLEFCSDFENIIKINFLILLFNKWREKYKLNYLSEREVELEIIKEFKNDIFRYLTIEKNRIDNEIIGIKNIKNLNNDYELLSNYYKKSDESSNNNESDEDSNKKSGGFSERNFFAHAGFEYNSVKVKKINDKIILMGNEIIIGNNGKSQDIKNILINRLPEIG